MPSERRSPVVSYRRFTADDIGAAYRLSSGLGWPHRAADWRFAFNAGQGYVAEAEHNVIGTVLCCRYGDECASVGMVMAAPEGQAQGVERELIGLLSADIAERVTVLHAPRDRRYQYEQLGFRSIGLVNQHQGAAFHPPLIPLPKGERLRPLGASDIPRLIELASLASGLDRSRLLPSLLNMAEGIGLDRDGELLGFALFRRFGRGYSIGPVVVSDIDDPHRAKSLISYWLARKAGALLRVDIPADRTLSNWIESLGLACVDTVVKMARNGQPDADPRVRQFGIISHSVG